jgi:uncharacterized protein YukE
MGMADDMRNLAQEIPASHDVRVRRVTELKRETGEMLKGFQRDLKAMATEVRGMLAGFQREREAMAAHWRGLVNTMARRRAGGQ